MICSTGGRGAMAVNQLAKAGFTKVFNIVNGLEGDMVNDPGSVYHGKHMRNGWKNCGLPWTYTFDPDLMWVAPEA
jgi:rhodanese-related sulfurtransferase